MEYKSAIKYSEVSYRILCIVFSLFVGFWILLKFDPSSFSPWVYDLFTDTYGIVALIGSLIGFLSVILWGGLKSLLGRSLMLFSVALNFQFLGQLVYGIYRNFFGIENPYPSFAEVFYFGSIPFYIWGLFLLLSFGGYKFSVNKTKVKLLTVVVPMLMLFFAYELLLQDYDFTSDPLLVFLDFGYPLLQAFQVSLAMIAYYISNNLSGGRFKVPFLILVVALLMQYIADTYYAYRVYSEQLTIGGISDLLYLLSYFIMGFALFQFSVVYSKVFSKLRQKVNK